MKGIVFTEFLELVEDKFGIKTVQDIIDACELKTNGVYTSVGTYDHKEMFQMVGKLSEIKNIPVPDLLQMYGTFFFSVLSDSYPKFMDKNDLFSFLESIDGYIHPEVLKLYPEAELPRFTSEHINDSEIKLIYESSRKMSDFAIGLINGAAEYYKQDINVEILKIEEEGKTVVLKITHIVA
jgi:hypothetical protein